MNEIPLDIERAALECWRTLPLESAGIAHIARAILAERERCAKIAMSRRSLPSRNMDAYGTTLAIDIASAIRNPRSSKLSSSQALTDMPGEVVPQPASPGANSSEVKS